MPRLRRRCVVTHYSINARTARTGHKCILCQRTIRPGETYWRGAGMDGATAWTWKECAHCDTIRDIAWQETHDDEYFPELLDDWKPASVTHMRLKVLAVRKRWTRRDGSLYPVPLKYYALDREVQVDVVPGQDGGMP